MTGKELARMHGTTIAMIRYYARIGIIPAAEHRNGKPRQYTEQECTTIELIETLSAAGLSLSEIVEYLAQRDEGAATVQSRMAILHERRARLIDKADRFQKMVEWIDREISACERV